MGASQGSLVGRDRAHHTCEQEVADGLQLSHRPYFEKGRSCSNPDSPWFPGRGRASHLSVSHHRLPGDQELSDTRGIQGVLGVADVAT